MTRAVALLAAAFAAAALVGPLASVAPRAAAAPASCAFAKTRFLLHAGLGFGAYRRYVSRPAQTGAFAGPHKLKAFAKAAAATVFAAHELHVAYTYAECSRILRPLATPLGRLVTSLVVLAAALHRDRADRAAVSADDAAVNGIERSSSSAGAAIHEQ